MKSSKNFHFATQIGWTKHSFILLGGFFLMILLIVYIWWPLAEEVLSFINWQGPWWLFMDWLLIGIFLFMSITIILRADLRVDGLIILVGTIGGLVIESWGTQTNIWFYYTAERPPLWIIPAWPIASLCIDRVERFLSYLLNMLSSWKLEMWTKKENWGKIVSVIYWFIFLAFFLLMLNFVAPTFSRVSTILATLLVLLLIITPTDPRKALLTFLAGSALGYFLERWGTTRQCWTYYTYTTPPLFAVLAHGMAAVSFWRSGLFIKQIWRRTMKWVYRKLIHKFFFR